MGIREIDGHSLYHFIISGASNLIYNEHMLNSINVFPVADGDTGTNLALTMRTIINQSEKDEKVFHTMASISKVALENAYGNSGIIFAQYFNGFSIETGERHKLSIREFAEIAEKASRYAYEAVANPKEGTILTIMREWAHDLRDNLHIADFERLFEHSVEWSKAKVDQTKTMLKVLIRNNVVDAGAKGFLLFLEGILEFIKHGRVHASEGLKAEIQESHVHLIDVPEVTKNTYCTQFSVKTEKDAEHLKRQVSGLGDSLVLSKSEGVMRIHVHTDHPEKVMDLFDGEDEVLSQRVEDMVIQNGILHHRKHGIAVVTDSIADIPMDFIRKEQITVIPVNLICDSRVYLDKLTMTSGIFYDRLDSFRMNPTTAQPTVASFEKAYANLLEHFDSVIGIFVSGKMSGIHGNATKAAASMDKRKKISVIDSGLNSAAQGLLVTEAVELIGKGLSHEEIVDALEKIKKDIHIYVGVDDLRSMIRGGRISRTTGFILRRINLKPVISIDEEGKGIIYKKTLSRKQALKGILEKVKSDLAETGIRKYGLVYSDSPGLVEDIRRKMLGLTGMEPAFVESISPVVGLNAGKGSYAVAYIKGR
ncbi:MAG: DegV family protein [Clostridia bacterium]